MKKPAEFTSLPESIQNEIISVLGCYSRVMVMQRLETGEYSVTTVVSLSAAVPIDCMVAEFTSSEILSEDERVLAYVANFRDFPWSRGLYKGKKDWAALNEWIERGGKKEELSLVDGDVAFSK